MSSIFDLTDGLKRAVAVPGNFAAVFPNTSNGQLGDTLMDAFAEAQLDGFLSTLQLDTETGEVTPDLSLPQQALVLIYGSARILTAELFNRKSLSRYKAGNVEYETEQGTLILRGLLDTITARKKQLLDRVASAGLLEATEQMAMGDLAFIKGTSAYASTGGLDRVYDYTDAGVI